MRGKMRNKRILVLLLGFMLSFTSPIVTIQAANEAETNTILMTETETEIPIETEPVIDETELRKELANSYVRLETKYQKEKTISHTIIGALIFGIVVLFGILVSVIIYYRKKIQNMRNFIHKKTGKKEPTETQTPLKQEIPKKKAEKTLQEAKKKEILLEEDISSKKKNGKETERKKRTSEEKYAGERNVKEKRSKEKVQKEKIQKETVLKENVQKQNTKSVSEKPKKIKSEIGRNGLEIFDFNDED